MLDFMRRNARSWGIRAALGVIILVFIFFMGGGGRLGAGPQSLIQVGDIEITRTDYEMAERRNESYFRQQFEGQMNEQLLKQMNIPKMTIDQLINGAALRAEAERIGLTVPEEAIRNELQKVPSFQSGGRFSPTLYRETLRSQGLTPGNFEETVRRQLLESQLSDIIRRGAHVSEEEAWQAWQREHRRMSLSYVAVDAAPLKSSVAADEDALKKFYDNRQEIWRRPPSVRVRHIAYKVPDTAAKIEVSDVDLNDYYEINKNSEFQAEEQVGARHILKKVDKDATPEAKAAARAAIEAIAKRIESGESFEEIAKTESDDGSAAKGGDLGMFGHGRMVPAFDTAAFSTEVGKVSPVVETEFGFHIIQVYDKKPAGVAPFDEVKDKIRTAIATQKAADRVFDDSAEDSAKIADGATLESIASARGVKIEETPLFSEGSVVPGLAGPAPAFMEAAFALSAAGQVSQPVKVGNDYYLIALAERKESYVPPLEEIRTQVESDYRDEQALDLARKKADEMLVAAKSGSSLQQLAEQNNLEVKSVDDIGGAANFVKDVGPVAGLSEVAFAAGKDGEPLSRSFVAGTKAYIFVRDSVTEANREEFEAAKKEQVKKLETAREQQALQEFIRSLKEKEKISYDLAQLRPLLGDSAPAVE